MLASGGPLGAEEVPAPAGAEVRPLHIGARLDGGRRAGHQHPAQVQDSDLGREPEDEVQVVFHEDQRDVGRQPAEKVQQLRGARRRHSGRRLVEQEYAGLGGERDGNLELATLGIGQRFDRVVGTVLDADDREHVVDPRRPGRPARYRQPRPPMPALDGQRHVVRGGQGPEKAGVLERLADARLRPACLRRVRDVPPVEPDMATGDAHSSGDQPEQRTLAGAVGPDECMPGPLRHGQVDAVHRMQRAERTAYAHTSQHVIHPASLAFDRGCCPRRDRRSPAIPRGSAYTTTMKTRPSTSGPRPPRLGASESRTRITRAAPRQGPQIVPLPPMTTASSASADVVKPRSAGVTSRCWAASSPPASPATAPAATNAASLYRNGCKPIARIRDSLSRMPRSVAPKGDAESDHRTSSPTRNHSSTYQCRYATLVSASPPAVTAGMPYMPLDPPVTGSQLSASC